MNIFSQVFVRRTTTLTLMAFQGEAGFAVQGVDELHEGGAGDVCHPGQVSEGGAQVGQTRILGTRNTISKA